MGIIFHRVEWENNNIVVAVLPGGKRNLLIFSSDKSSKLQQFPQGSRMREKERSKNGLKYTHFTVPCFIIYNLFELFSIRYS